MRPAHIYATPTPQQHNDLVTALHRDWRIAARVVMILLSASGMSAPDIAELLHYNPATVRRWIDRHARDGIDALPDRPRSGRPRLGSPRLGQRIRTLLSTPKAWTTTRLWRAAGLPKMSARTFYRRLREQARWCRPRLIAKGDPDHDTICADIRTRVAALPSGAVALDAHRDTTPDPHPRIQHPRRTVHGAVNLATGAFHHHVSVKNVSVVFCYFLELLLETYPDAPVVAVISDNGSTHGSGITQKWLNEHPRLMFIPGAKYSPQDNPVERIWAALKHHIANTAPATMADRVRQTHAYFQHRTDTQTLTTAAPWTSPWLPKGYGQDFWQPA